MPWHVNIIEISGHKPNNILMVDPLRLHSRAFRITFIIYYIVPIYGNYVLIFTLQNNAAWITIA